MPHLLVSFKGGLREVLLLCQWKPFVGLTVADTGLAAPAPPAQLGSSLQYNTEQYRLYDYESQYSDLQDNTVNRL